VDGWLQIINKLCTKKRVYFVSWSTGSHADLPLKYEENNHSNVIIILKKELGISVTCEKPLDAVGVESGSGNTNQGFFDLPAPSLCPPALWPCLLVEPVLSSLDVVFYKLNGANPLSNGGEMRRMNCIYMYCKVM